MSVYLENINPNSKNMKIDLNRIFLTYLDNYPDLLLHNKKIINILLENNHTKIFNLMVNRKKYNLNFDKLIILDKFDSTGVILNYLMYLDLNNNKKIYKKQNLLKIKDYISRHDYIPYIPIIEKIIKIFGIKFIIEAFYIYNTNYLYYVLNSLKLDDANSDILIIELTKYHITSKKIVFNKILNIMYFLNPDHYDNALSINIKKKFNENIPNYLDIYWNRIKLNAYQCRDFKNNYSLLSMTWAEVFSDSTINNIVYHDTHSNYGFVLESLLKHWNYQLNGFNYTFSPCLPSNPYTKIVYELNTVYYLVLLAIQTKVKIPNSLQDFIKCPEMMLNVYNNFNKKNKQDNEFKNYFVYKLRDEDFEYYGGNSIKNESGEWYHSDLKKHDYPISEDFIKLCLIKLNFQKCKFN